jgi:hypothetical protein
MWCIWCPVMLATKVGNLIGANEKEDTQEIIS